jgi:hypothetical protein
MLRAVERVIDLDEAAARITAQAPLWRAAGLTVGQVTWRDAAAPWPWRLETDRTLVTDPDSVGVLVTGPNDTALSVVLFRGGWADVDYIADLDDAGALEASDIASALDFGRRLDGWAARAFDQRPGQADA